jgi:hypothetical protein
MSSSFDEKAVPVFDGSNFLLWQEQMRGFMSLKKLWRHMTTPIPRPAAAGAAQDKWDENEEEAIGALILKIAPTMRAGIFVVAKNTSALLWTTITTNFARQGIAGPYQDFRAAMRVKIGTSNPAKDMTRLQTHFDRLTMNNAAVPGYIQGMMLMDALPDVWDHICDAVLTEFNRKGGSRADQTHIADRLSAVKRKGKSPQFSKQKGTNDYRPATDEAGPSNPQKRRRNRPNRGKTSSGSHQHSHVASMADMQQELDGRPLYNRFLHMQL